LEAAMWSSSFVGFWTLTRQSTIATKRRLLNWTLTCDDIRTATGYLSAHLMRDIGLHERCDRDDGYHD
jgi:hypothetical protein